MIWTFLGYIFISYALFSMWYAIDDHLASMIKKLRKN